VQPKFAELKSPNFGQKNKQFPQMPAQINTARSSGPETLLAKTTKARQTMREQKKKLLLQIRTAAKLKSAL